MKKTRVNSRSPSPADDNPHSASRTAYPASHRDHLSLFAGNDDEFSSHSEDNQDLTPDTLRHSGHTGNPSGITAHIVWLFSFVTLTQVNLFRLCCLGIVSGFVLVLKTLSIRDIMVVSSLAQERRRSHIRRGNSLPLLVLLTAFPSLLLEKEKGNGTCLKKKHISLRSFNMTSVRRNIGGRRVLLYFLLSLLQFSSDSFSAQQRSSRQEEV